MHALYLRPSVLSHRPLYSFLIVAVSSSYSSLSLSSSSSPSSCIALALAYCLVAASNVILHSLVLHSLHTSLVKPNSALSPSIADLEAHCLCMSRRPLSRHQFIVSSVGFISPGRVCVCVLGTWQPRVVFAVSSVVAAGVGVLPSPSS